MREICFPLFQQTPITFFQYMKTFDDGNYMALSMSGEWIENYFEKKYYRVSNFRQPSQAYNEEYLLTSSFNQKIVRDAVEGYGIDSCISLVEKGEKSCEFYLFASTLNNIKIFEFYLNNIDFLRLFVFSFKDKGCNLIKKHSQNKFILPRRSLSNNSFVENIKVTTINNSIRNSIKRYYLNGKHEGIYLTRREVGIILDFAEKTIEAHVNNIKQKLNCSRLTQVITLLSRDYFFKIIIRIFICTACAIVNNISN